MAVARKKIGKLTIPPDTFPEKHEIIVANVFIKLGYDVTFLKPSIGYKAKTPDIRMRGLDWEIKSPAGHTRHTISRHIKFATKQSRNIILDATRTKLEDELVERQLRKDMAEHRSIRYVILVMKDLRAVDIR